MGKRSGMTKSGRVMNPADRERKQQRAKELKRNKKQRTIVRQAIVKNRNPEDLIEQMVRLDEQEFDPTCELALVVIQEKRFKLRGAFLQIISLARQEKEEKKSKQLEKMLYEYELERAKKEENFRAQQFSASANFEDIPLPCGVPDSTDSAKTPFLQPPGISPHQPAHLQAAARAGILKKPGAPAGKRHRHPPGPPPGLPPSLSDSEDEEDDDGEDGEDRRRRVRFGGEERVPHRRRPADNDGEAEEEYEEEDFAPVEIPESMLAAEKRPPPHQEPVYSRAAPPVVLPPPHQQMGGRPLPPGMAPPPPAYPPGYYPPPQQHMPPEMHAQAMRTGRMPQPPQQQGKQHHNQQQTHQSKTGLISYSSDEPNPSAVISAAPQVVKPSVDVGGAAAGSSVAGGAGAAAIISAAPQMRNLARETTRFVPTAVKIQRPLVQQPPSSGIGPHVPSVSAPGAGIRFVPTAALKKRPTAPQQQRSKTADEACDDFLRELQGLL